MNSKDDSLDKNDDDAVSDVGEPESDNVEPAILTEGGTAPLVLRQLFPAGFAQSLLPKLNIKPFSAALGFKYESPVNALAKKMQAQFSPWEKLGQQVRSKFAPFEDLPRLMLPPNLRSVAGGITAADVWYFLEEEGIPLYLIPRATIGKRLVLAKDHAGRRKVLNDRFIDIVDDCAALLDTCSDPIVVTEVHFIRDGIGALRGGHYAAAQAIFTVTLDTLIARFYPVTTRGRRLRIARRALRCLTRLTTWTFARLTFGFRYGTRTNSTGRTRVIGFQTTTLDMPLCTAFPRRSSTRGIASSRLCLQAA